ncbi:VOC family protein [Lichenihabitans sp. Uapishka_5]|uniref:VOC family protein n=1 Tax=Lichenihabitans sp. Uapishka_5 TaxID=3037302 RepID=UPI0029E80AC6|nr:VOC family protein [Lichenihabitans sp. Uapishka_5]MDX7949725.1 VOC family protein [Lichenihabitans sp. Uapishka_5]
MTTGTTGSSHIETVTRTVPDLAVAHQFYAAAWGCVSEGEPVALSSGELDLLDATEARGWRQTLRLGRQSITLLNFLPQGRPYPTGSRSSDLWFQHCAVVVSDMASAYTRVMQAGAQPISEHGPQRLPANTGGVAAFKFRDPTGHPLELLFFPTGIGDPSWHTAAPPVFQGVDHTAIAVSDADTSAAFYADVLAFTVTACTRNAGIEQSKLDAVPNDAVDVVALQPGASPPHLELLGYRTGSRRAAPAASGIDAVASRTILVGDMARIRARLSARGHAMRQGVWDGSSALSFQDPDGHRWICKAAVRD